MVRRLLARLTYQPPPRLRQFAWPRVQDLERSYSARLVPLDSERNRRTRTGVASGKRLFGTWLQRTYLLLVVIFVVIFCCSLFGSTLFLMLVNRILLKQIPLNQILMIRPGFSSSRPDYLNNQHLPPQHLSNEFFMLDATLSVAILLPLRQFPRKQLFLFVIGPQPHSLATCRVH